MMLMLTAVDCRRQRAPAWSSCQGVARVAPDSSRGDALAPMAGGAVTTFLTPLQLPLPTHTPTPQPSQLPHAVASGIRSSTASWQLHRNCPVRPRCCCASLLLTPSRHNVYHYTAHYASHRRRRSYRVLAVRIKAKLTVGIACSRDGTQEEAGPQAQGCQGRVADRDGVAADSHKESRYVTRKCRAPSHCDNNHIIHNHHHGKSSRRGQEAHQSRSRRIESSRRRGLTTAQSRTDKTCEAGSRYSPAEGHQSEAKSSCCQAGGYDC